MNPQSSIPVQPGTPAAVRRQQIDTAKFVDVRNLAYLIYKKPDGSPLMTYQETLENRDRVKDRVLEFEIMSGWVVPDGTGPAIQQPTPNNGNPQMSSPVPPPMMMPQPATPTQAAQVPVHNFQPAPQQFQQMPPQMAAPMQQMMPPQMPMMPPGMPPPMMPPSAPPQMAPPPATVEQAAAAPAPGGKTRRTKGSAVAPPPPPPPQGAPPQQMQMQMAPPMQQAPVAPPPAPPQFAPPPQAPQFAPPPQAPQVQQQAPAAPAQDLKPLIDNVGQGVSAAVNNTNELKAHLDYVTKELHDTKALLAQLCVALHHLYLTSPAGANQQGKLNALPDFTKFLDQYTGPVGKPLPK